ncbi:acetolactate synthase small subunit, partial [Salmonella sp. hn-h4]|nr:acetolactate synthase small subunit [Salmonella sp. hn-h4]
IVRQTRKLVDVIDVNTLSLIGDDSAPLALAAQP